MSAIKHRSRPRSPKSRKIWDRLKSLGFRDVTLWWEPIGPALEMCGYSGGYIAELNGATVPLGLNMSDALCSAERHAEYVRAES